MYITPPAVSYGYSTGQVSEMLYRLQWSENLLSLYVTYMHQIQISTWILWILQSTLENTQNIIDQICQIIWLQNVYQGVQCNWYTCRPTQEAGVDKKRNACERNGSAFEAGRKTDPARRNATRSFSGLVCMRYKSLPRLCANVCDLLYMFWGPK